MDIPCTGTSQGMLSPVQKPLTKSLEPIGRLL
jgi:hypothetical protein